jgi:hypothetical protein
VTFLKSNPFRFKETLISLNIKDSSKLQGYLNFAFDQREIEVNLHNATTSPSNVSPAYSESDFLEK